MLTAQQITAILAAPGSYGYWCVMGATSEPFFCHEPHGRILHHVTAVERAAQSAHTFGGPAVSMQAET